jgi:hypothetical protein
MKSNSGHAKAPSPKAVSVFPGIKGLLASGAGTKKTPMIQKLRPEGAVHIDAGNVKRATGTNKMAAGSPKKIMGSGHKGVGVSVRPEGAIKRDAAHVVKP